MIHFCCRAFGKVSAPFTHDPLSLTHKIIHLVWRCKNN